MSQHVEIAIIGANLKEGIVGAVPLVEDFFYQVSPILQLKTNGLLVSFLSRVTLDVQRAAQGARSFLDSNNAGRAGSRIMECVDTHVKPNVSSPRRGNQIAVTYVTRRDLRLEVAVSWSDSGRTVK